MPHPVDVDSSAKRKPFFLPSGRDGREQNLQGPESQPGQREAHGGVRAVSQRRECHKKYGG